jgi:uncharacterized protein YjbI with pentapeptide repeats
VFARCTFRRTSFFAAALLGCKLVGSGFSSCTLTPMQVEGGDWSFVSLEGSDLTGVDLSGVRLDEADLSGANLTRATFRGARMSRSVLAGATLDETDLAGAALDGVDLRGLDWRRTKLDPVQLLLLAEQLGIDVSE